MAPPGFGDPDPLGRYPVFMVIAILVGAVLGFLAGLGIGGGSLLILWLTMALGMDPATARGINLLFFLPCAVTSILVRRKNADLKIRPLLPAILSGCAAALIFSFLGTGLNLELLKKLFGGLLIVTGIRELFYKSGE